MAKRRWFEMAAKANGEADIYIYDAIGKSYWDDGTVGAKAFADEFNALLKTDPSVINLRINSPGGDVSEGTAIYNTILRAQDKVVVHIEGWVASIASVIALAGRTVRMADNALFMIHNPSAFAAGGAEDMRKTAELLDKAKEVMLNTYEVRSGKTREEIAAAMDDETWLSADEAREWGFVDEVFGGAAMAAQFDREVWAGVYKRMPEAEEERREQATKPAQTEETRAMAEEITTPKAVQEGPVAASYDDLVAACSGADPAFICEQLGKKATTAQATRGWMEAQAAKLAAKEAELEAVKAQAEKPVKAIGHAPLGMSGDPEASGMSAEERWRDAIQAKIRAGMTKRQAVPAVVHEDPDLHAAFVAEYNAAHGRG